MDCLAAQLVAHFKKGIGSFYICQGFEDCIDYSYEIRLEEPVDTGFYAEQSLRLRVWEWWDGEDHEPFFEGTPFEFLRLESEGEWE
jgi:hypothetical protein